MMNARFVGSSRVARSLAALLALGLLLTTTSAMAWGRVQWTKKVLKERKSNGSWKIEIKIFLPRAPDVAHVPMRFEFTPTAYFERARVDGPTKEGKLVERRVPLVNRQAIIENVDVGFLDPRNGQTQKRTKFSFKVTRAHSFDAGEYRVKIRDSRGRTVGAPTRLVFEGENPVIDRRTISFVPGEGKKKKKKSQMKKVDRYGEIKDDDGDSEGGGSGTFHGLDPEDEQEVEPEEPSSGDESTEGGAEEEEAEGTADGDEGPPPIKEKPGGCGCRIGAEGRTGAVALVPVLALGVAAVGRRRRRPRRPVAR